jgi:lipid-binding SYLF domain-containing protein
MISRLTRRSAITLAAAALLAAGLPLSAHADEQQDLVDRSRIAVGSVTSLKELDGLNKLLNRAKGVLIVPQMLKAAFFIGGSGGSGVLVSRNDKGDWSSPAFFTMGAGSFGLQFGGSASEVMLLLMTDKAVQAVVKNKVKLGAEVSAAAGPVGAELEAATTTNLHDDVYSYSRSGGLFIGASLEGAVIAPREEWNEAYYGRKVSIEDILAGKVANAGANSLAAALKKAERGN